MITHDKAGGRAVELFIPFDHNGKRIERIVLGPFRFGDLLRWTDGDFKKSLDLIVEMAGVDELVIRNLRYPDADRVMEAFMSILPNEVRDDIANGRIPQKQQAEPVPEERVTNGSGEPPPPERVNLQGPGVPLPMEDEAGFDLSEEP